MKKINFGELGKDYEDRVGGKARGLDQLVSAGFNVAPGFILAEVDLEKNFDEAIKHYNESGLGVVAVRSSASNEDGADFSFAGQFTTVLNVSGEEEFKKAIIDCVKSLESNTATCYSCQVGGKQQAKMSVVVQQMIETDVAGVCFTSDPQNAGNILIEAVEGLGEQLVSGMVQSVQYSIAKTQVNEIGKDSFDKLVPHEILKQICLESLEISKIFGTELDLEWGIKDGKLYWFQARPITVLEECRTDEFNPKFNVEGHTITRCNISEMLPGAATPLSIYTTFYAIDWGIRKMIHTSGANKKMKALPDFGCVFSSHGHLFLDLSSLYRMTKTTLLATKGDVELSICDRHLAEEERGVVPGKKLWFGARAINSVKYLKFILSVGKAKKRIAKLSNNFTIGKDGMTMQELFDAIIKAQDVSNKVAYYHYATSGHSGAMSSAATKELDKKFNDREKSRAVLAQLLERIDGIESVDILASLCRLANAVVVENADAKNYNNDQLLEYLENASDNVKDLHKAFMTRHGHRAIREAELRSKSWANDDQAFAGYLKTVIAGNMAVPEVQTPPDLVQILLDNGFTKKQAKKIAFFARQARNGVRNREYSKSKLIKVYDGFKQAFSRLAAMMVEQGLLPDQDAIYFLIPEEIGTLIKGENPALHKKVLQRRRLLKEQQEFNFPEVCIGIPQPIVQEISLDGGDVFKGTAVSRGKVTGVARVVKSVEDAAQLQKGEIMVASFTDIGWSPFYALIDGLVTEVGGALSHGAVVAREYALPLVSNIVAATLHIKTGDRITVDGNAGTVQKVS
ncbi:MAG: PEP-utilizing enzyme [Firmicutes bacterium]|nr:PEP-utilizing enzyme [Bacillota bacterium]